MDQFALSPTDAVETAPPARRRRLGWLWATIAIVVIAAGAAGVQLWANLDYDDAEAAYVSAQDAAAMPTHDLNSSLAHSAEIAEAAEKVNEVRSRELLSAEDREAIAAEAAQLRQRHAESEAIGLDAPQDAAEKPILPWELLSAASGLRDRTSTLTDRTAEQVSATQALNSANRDLTDLGRGIIEAAQDAVPKIEASAVDARIAPVVALREAADQTVYSGSSFSPADVQTLLDLDTAVIAVKKSAEAERAAKAGPLYEARREAEKYARSIAGGVLLEFVWKEHLLGFGAGESGAGTATWDTADGGTSHIELTNSIARYWPADWTRALVAHEVGHAISAKCYEKFDWKDKDANEQWATAWAMSWGHSPYNAGVNNYGMPSEKLRKAAASCR